MNNYSEIKEVEFKGFNSEQKYYIGKQIALNLLNQGKINEMKYKRIHEKLVKKYRPIMSTLVMDV